MHDIWWVSWQQVLAERRKKKHMMVFPLVDKNILEDQYLGVYDNIIYAKEMKRNIPVEESVVFATCQRISNIEKKIDQYARMHNVPFDLLLGLVLVESEGKAHAGNKSLKSDYYCYGYTQISVLMGKAYNVILPGRKKNTRIDHRDNLDSSLDATCKILSDFHNRFVSRWYADKDRSITFSAYHMGEPNMDNILKLAEKASGKKPQQMLDVYMINDKDLAVKFLSLDDESYKYYPKLMVAWSIYQLYTNDIDAFKQNIQVYLDAPFSRRPSLAEEYPWYQDAPYYPDSAHLVAGMQSGELVGVLALDNDIIIDDQIWSFAKSKEKKELMRMASPAVRGFLKFLSHHCPFDIKVSSLTRSEHYNSAYIYKTTQKKWTSHATGLALDLGLPPNRENMLHLYRTLYQLELQWMIAFLKEKNHFHISINPEYRDFFASIALGKSTNKGFACSRKKEQKEHKVPEANPQSKEDTRTYQVTPWMIRKTSHKNLLQQRSIGWFNFLRVSHGPQGQYYIYKYFIKYWWKPIDVRQRFLESFPDAQKNTILITDGWWTPHKEQKRFSAWDSVYVKVRI